MIQILKWTPRNERRRRFFLVVAALLLAVPGVWAFVQWNNLTPCLRYGKYGGGVNVFIERDGKLQRAGIGLRAIRVESGLWVHEEISMSIQFDGDRESHPFQIRPNDTIVLTQSVLPEFRSVLQGFPSMYRGPSIPLRSLVGSHSISDLYHRKQFDDPTLYGAESLRPSILWLIMVLSGMATAILSWLAFRSYRRLQRVRRGLCPICKYPMLIRQDEDIRCSECGTEIILDHYPYQVLVQS
ncbi:MAG TPA: hypothetical protein ENJ00_02350 [Phycisphaerales bacterium]|nr:hypothetical protein [Phycisphaerales bacterium]